MRGFTLIELLIVVAITVLISALSIATLASFEKAQAFDGDSRLILSTLAEARNDTLLSKNESQYGVHVTSSSLTIFSGTTYTANASTNQVFNLSGYDTLSSSLSGGATGIIFIQLTGETTDTGTLVLTSKTSTQIATTTIYATGIAQ